LRALLGALALILATAPAFAAELPGGLPAHWSLDSASIADLLGDRAMRLDPPIDYGVAQAKLMVKAVRIGGVAMNAFYQFDTRDRLVQVLLERRDAGATPASFDALERALARRYGKPTQACAQLRGSPKALERRWLDGKTAVNLTFFDFTGAAMTLDPSKDFLNPLVPSYEYESFKARGFPRRIVLRYFLASRASLEGSPACAEPRL